MVTRVVLSVALGALVLLAGKFASAEPMPLLHPAVLCVPSASQTDSELLSSKQNFCLLRLAPWFDGTSFELMPRLKLTRHSEMKRLGADFELRF
jgi:hypothetical protein